jgi:carboxymethylenebutenolidase
MARRIATVGYFVILPNLYYRQSRDFWLKERTPEAMEGMFVLMNGLSNAMTVIDTAAMLAYADAQPAADASRVGAVGYCMSGPFVMAAAASFPDRIACIAAIHPAQMVTDKPDSPHLMAPKVKCESYFGCAQTDKWAPPEVVATLESALKAAGTPHRIEWYPDTEHGFVFPKRTGIYHQVAAERHWERLFEMFRRKLQLPAAA